MPGVPNGALRLPIPVTVQSKSDRISTFLKSIGHCTLNVRSLVATGSTLRRGPPATFSPAEQQLYRLLNCMYNRTATGSYIRYLAKLYEQKPPATSSRRF